MTDIEFIIPELDLQEINSDELFPFVMQFLAALNLNCAMLTDRSSIHDFVWGDEELHESVELALGLELEENESVLSIVRRLQVEDPMRIYDR